MRAGYRAAPYRAAHNAAVTSDRIGSRLGGPVRDQRRREHRLPGDRRRSDRPRLHRGRVHQSRRALGAAGLSPLSRTAGRVHAAPDLRQARHGAVRPRSGRDAARGSDGRHPCGDGRRRIGACCRHGRVGGRSAGDPLRGGASRSNELADPPGRRGPRASGGRVAVGRTRSRSSRSDLLASRTLGQRRQHYAGFRRCATIRRSRPTKRGSGSCSEIRRRRPGGRPSRVWPSISTCATSFPAFTCPR